MSVRRERWGSLVHMYNGTPCTVYTFLGIYERVCKLQGIKNHNPLLSH
jgi:hypothetical protein